MYAKVCMCVYHARVATFGRLLAAIAIFHVVYTLLYPVRWTDRTSHKNMQNTEPNRSEQYYRIYVCLRIEHIFMYNIFKENESHVATFYSSNNSQLPSMPFLFALLKAVKQENWRNVSKLIELKYRVHLLWNADKQDDAKVFKLRTKNKRFKRLGDEPRFYKTAKTRDKSKFNC